MKFSKTTFNDTYVFLGNFLLAVIAWFSSYVVTDATFALFMATLFNITAFLGFILLVITPRFINKNFEKGPVSFMLSILIVLLGTLPFSIVVIVALHYQ